MKKIYLPLISFILLATPIFSQNEANHWRFGFGNGIDFNSDPPIAVNSFFNFFAEQNTVSISDANGNLQFYSDGNTIFDKLDNPMPNGFINNNSNLTHSIFAIPKPGAPNSYFFISNNFIVNGLIWQEIDMSLNNGNGDLVPSVGGLLMTNPIGKITAVQHSNQQDIWIISHESGTNIFKAWLATNSGISSVSVDSPIGNIIDPNINFNNGQGQIKTSTNGRKIAVANMGLNNVEVFDIDPTTGILTNAINISNVFIRPNGIEFSPDGRYLYVTHDGINFIPELFQIDLWAGSTNDIINSATLIGQIGGFDQAGALQLGPDEKIYIANPFDFSLGAINDPNLAGANCNFNFVQLFLQNDVILGLPSFYHAYFKSTYFSYDGLCPGDVTTFTIEEFTNPIDSVYWNFGDSASGNNNTSTNLTPSHTYPGTGTYNVELTIYSGGQSTIAQGPVSIAPTSLYIGPDQNTCSNKIVTLSAFTPNAAYQWSDGSTNSSIDLDTPGEYSVEVLIGNCPVLRDTMVLNHIQSPNASLGGDGGLCNGEEVVLDVTNPNSSYIWSTGSTSPILTVVIGGTYSVTVTNINGCSDSDQANFQFDQVAVNPVQLDLTCPGGDDGVAKVFPTAGIQPFSYSWSDGGDTLYTRNDLSGGTHYVTVTDALGCSVIETFHLDEPDEIEAGLNIVPDNMNTGAPDGSVTFQPSGGTPPYTFDWDIYGEISNTLVGTLASGTYQVTIIDSEGCEKELTIEVGSTTTSTKDLILLEKIQLYPNPVQDFLFLKIPKALNENLEISISNTLGQQMSENHFLEKGTSDFSIDVNSWASGIYFIKIKLQEEEKIWKVNVIK